MGFKIDCSLGRISYGVVSEGSVMNNGVSKKLCLTIIAIQAIIQMSNGSEDKIYYALIIAGLVVVYKVVQALIDWKTK